MKDIIVQSSWFILSMTTAIIYIFYGKSDV